MSGLKGAHPTQNLAIKIKFEPGIYKKTKHIGVGCEPDDIFILLHSD